MNLQRKIGVWKDISIEMAAWDGAEAPVNLSCACMFEREIGNAGWAGGMRHLDAALGGALSALRRSGAFRGSYLETLLLDRLPPAIPAQVVLVIGLGDPDAWTPSVSAMAAATAVRMAMQHRFTSCAFAPSLLDAGFDGRAISGVAQTMMKAVLTVIGAQEKVTESGLASAHRLRRWIFDVGVSHFDQTTESFQQALSASARRA
ncbi:M17 family peptidase N-terminal domain-containing protein [Rhodanobacter sp. OK091]|uniref:M17 family peptidase N-terminal domain-containing protein n=1 Tax=Rhodanobacter sp. OK091 TaxID=1881037 RepID=UPI00091EDBC8|nr:M17 family peptidase N-terminal domain-containing protein [Rhodanobacter sp. OK091]SHM15293.1 Cytosol aminopeptidase family, N-terminal domain [Rhodanobacter sp. OK091]